MEKSKINTALPLLDEFTARQAISTNMQFNSDFIYTRNMVRSDLGQCVISTHAPHYVCKLHTFKTSDERIDSGNPKRREAVRNERRAHVQWLKQRLLAFRNASEAMSKGISVKELMGQRNRVYDEEFDEPRLVAKLPGLNAYLELYGCLDNIGKDDFNWEEARQVVGEMSLWAVNIFEEKERNRMATRPDDYQPISDWSGGYDHDTRPQLPPKRGIGFGLIDVSRRPEYKYTHISGGGSAVRIYKDLRDNQARLARQGIGLDMMQGPKKKLWKDETDDKE